MSDPKQQWWYSAEINLQGRETRSVLSLSLVIIESLVRVGLLQGWRKIKELLSGVEYKGGVMVTNENQGQEAVAM